MFINAPLPFVNSFIDKVNEAIQEYNPDKCLTHIQKNWIGFCIMSVLMTNTVCWANFAKTSMGKRSLAALSWMFRKSKIPWEILLVSSTRAVLRRHGIIEGCLGIDDTDKKRSKSTRKISNVHKIKDKTSGGYIMGQSLVFLVLITPKITIPVGFAFHMPDPKLTAWRKLNKKFKKQGISKCNRPIKPQIDENFLTMAEIALKLLEQFKQDHADINIKCIFADALYGTGIFLDRASTLFGGIQVISQIRSNQNIRFRGKEKHGEDFFLRYPAITQKIKIRGGKKMDVIMASDRLHVCSHGRKRFVIALKYEDEKNYRYIVASDLSWRTQDIIEAYTLRWLVEFFFEDWKGHEGWGRLTKQPGDEGSDRSLILSLLVDHCLFFHPDQLAFLENNLPACTVGSLVSKIKVECLVAFIQEIACD
uniref:transposase n=1 Tax=Desulfobacula sp. TaxID=2593537 RepID=UPI00260B01A7